LTNYEMNHESHKIYSNQTPSDQGRWGWRWVRINSIRTRLLVAFVLTVLVVAIAISSVTMILGTRDGQRREIDQLESVVTLKQAEIKSWVNNLNINLNLVTSDLGEMNDIRTLLQYQSGTGSYSEAYDRLSNRFQWASGSMGLFDELFLMGPDGNVILSTNPAHENEKNNVYDYFIEGTKGTYIQQPSYSVTSGEMTVMTSAPIINEGTLLGVVAGRASLKSLNDIMIERAGLGNTGETYLVGSNHNLLTGLRDTSYAIPETNIQSQGVNAALDEHLSGFKTYLNYNGKMVIGVYRWLPDLRVALLAEQEQGEALQATSIALWIVGGVTLAVVVLIILIAMFITRSIVKPLDELSETASLIAAGDMDRIARVKRDDEVGTVAKAFNSMTTRLRDLVRSLERRTDQLRAINETGRHISSILNLDELLAYVVSSLQKTFAYHNVGIYLINPRTGVPTLRFSAGAFEGGPDINQGIIETNSIVGSAVQTKKTLLINDIINDPRYSATEGAGKTRAELAVPIKLGERILGVLDIEEDGVNAFDDLDVFTTQTLADQLAIAIENAHLYEQAQELATVQERQRLARDLHDAVSQTLFSSSLIAEVLPRLWEKNPDEARKRLEEIRQLTRGALAEMRTLLLELRPATLVDANLGELLRQLAESITGRARIPVSVNVDGECPASAELKVALYRIAQEALNNVAKHSRATLATVDLHCQPDKLELVIRDDGKGFDIKTRSPSSLGLGIMQERAKSINATVTITSQVDKGTAVTVLWLNNQLEEKNGRIDTD
jgi:signal transduction histidine kinase